MSKPRILVQLDPDPHASVFDAVVAIDSDVDHLLQYRGVEPQQVRDLVFGTMFTRSPDDLKSTAIFIGGSNVAAGENLLREVKACFFGPMRVSVLLDANGANTTAAAAVLSAKKHVPLAGATAVVLAGTGPVGQRAARLLAREGAIVRLASRNLDRAEAAAQAVCAAVSQSSVTGHAAATPDQLPALLEGASIVIAAGAPGIELLPAKVRAASKSLRVAIDLNAVPPLGIEGVQQNEKGAEREGIFCYGALGVGGKKMKIHKAAIRQLFARNDQVLDAEEVYALGADA